MNGTKDSVLEVKKLSISIKLDEGLLTPVRGVDLQLYRNETLGLVGESGCGKSLLCKAVIGINDKKFKSEGSVHLVDENGKAKELLGLQFGGKEIRSIRGKSISMIFQEPMSSFSPLFTVGHQISENVRLHVTRDKQEARRMTIKMMQKVGIANAEQRYKQYPHEFSGGMLQRSLIAMALICQPHILIADEPTTALDVTIQAQILQMLKNLQKDVGMSIIYITHDLGTVAQICDRVAVMYLGKIIEIATVDEIFKNPLHPYTEGLIHSVHKIGGKTERLFSIEGFVPLAMNLDNRCGFYDRCTRRNKECLTLPEPHLVQTSEGHSVACYKYTNNSKPELLAKEVG